MDGSVGAILVKLHSGSGFGFVRTYDDLGYISGNVIIGQGREGWVVLLVEPGEQCWILGDPTVRYFRWP